MIIPALHARQDQRGGYLTKADLNAVAVELAIPLYRVQSLVSFFPHFRTTPPAKVEVHICRDMSCHLRGSTRVIDELASWAQSQFGDEVHISGVSCLGRCDRAPAAIINEKLFVERDANQMKQIITSEWNGESPVPNTDWQRAEAQVGKWDMDVYAGKPTYDAVRKFIEGQKADQVIKTLEKAGLLGMGGAGGRTYLKWNDVLRAQGLRKFVVCNADESEPGTFKDRDIMLAAPHLLVEGMILAGLVVGATRGWIYIRHEYHEQIEMMRAEIARALKLNVLGNNILESKRRFELEVFVSPGGYICGEQTALIEAMENKRAEPRNRPPELMTNGYQDQPTLLNNVETFAWVPAIMLRSAGEWYAAQGNREGPWVAGQAKSMRGKRLFSISGDVARPGVYEVPTGISLGELIDEHCGGMAPGKDLVAVALSGPSGGLLPPRIPLRLLNRKFVIDCVPPGLTEFDIRELPLDINISRAIGLMIGAGLVVYGTGCDVLSEANACSRFFRNESCGKCVPCRIGSEKITAMGEDLQRGRVSREELPVLKESTLDLAQVMTATSICGLGQVASNPVRSILTYFPEVAERACRYAYQDAEDELIHEPEAEELDG